MYCIIWHNFSYNTPTTYTLEISTTFKSIKYSTKKLDIPFKKIAKRFALCAHSPSPPLNFRVDFRSAECVPPRPRSISDWQSVFHHVPFDFRSAECVPPRPGSNSGQQSVFHRVPGQFPVGRVCSAASRVNFQSAECVLPRPWSISEW